MSKPQNVNLRPSKFSNEQHFDYFKKIIEMRKEPKAVHVIAKELTLPTDYVSRIINKAISENVEFPPVRQKSKDKPFSISAQGLEIVNYKLAHPLITNEGICAKFNITRPQLTNFYYLARKNGIDIPYEKIRRAYGMFIKNVEETPTIEFGKQEPDTDTIVQLPLAHQNFKFEIKKELNYIFFK
jgi:hypothetical protein